MSQQIPAAPLTANDSTAKGELGQVWIKGPNAYRYMRVKDLAVAAGQVVEYSTTTSAVTKDRSGGTSIGRAPAGVAVATITAGNYGWIQIAGEVNVLVPAGVAIAANNIVATHATSDGGVIAATTSTLYRNLGFALGADTATTSAAGVAKVRLNKLF